MRSTLTFQKFLCIVTITALFTNLNIAEWVGLGEKLNLNLYYLLLPFLFLSLPKYKSSLKNSAFALLILFSAFNFFAYFRFGFDAEALRIIIAILSFLVGYSLSKSKTELQISAIFNVAGVAVITLILLRFITFPDLSLKILSGDRNALIQYPFLTTGGHNIEVTYLIFLSILCGNRRIVNTLILLSAILSLMYMSRVGIILLLLIFSFKMYRHLSRVKFILAMSSLLILTPLALSIISPKTVERFTNLSQEVEYGDQGVGRIGLFKGAQALLNQNAFGYGVGNSIDMMSKTTGVTYKENNVHNIYLQVLLDAGIISFVFFVYFSFKIIRRSASKITSNKFLILSASYLIIGVIQFTGLDALGWLCIGLAYPSLMTSQLKRKSNHLLQENL